MKYLRFVTLIVALIIWSGFTLSIEHKVSLKTSTGHIVRIHQGTITYDNHKIFKMKYDDVMYESKSNGIVEDHGTTFLFVAMAGNPNLDRLKVFVITPQKATLVADAILSKVKDFDGDGYLEFGGSDLTEQHPSPDSMNYIPTAYFEIRDGKIYPDKLLTRRRDIEINGRYIPEKNQLDKHGFCCVVIPKPKVRGRSDQ